MAHPFIGSASDISKQRLRGKRFTRLTRDVYIDGANDIWARARAAALVFPDAVMCGSTAALLQNLPVDDDGIVHLCRGQLAARSERPGFKTHRLDIEADEVMVVRGVLVSQGPRTLSDLAAHLSFESLVAVGDVVARRYTRDEIDEAVRRSWGRAGVASLRRAVPLLDGGADSPAETRARLRLHAAGFTALRHKLVVTDEAGGWLAEPDLGDPLARVAVQHDGGVHFDEDPRRRQHDADRDELSRLMDWEVVVSTAKDDRSPDLLVAKVTAAYRRAATRWGDRVLPDHLRAA
jgi:hypothetical protein